MADIYRQQLDALADRAPVDALAATDRPAAIRQTLFAEARRVRAQTAAALIAYADRLDGLCGD